MCEGEVGVVFEEIGHGFRVGGEIVRVIDFLGCPLARCQSAEQIPFVLLGGELHEVGVLVVGYFHGFYRHIAQREIGVVLCYDVGESQECLGIISIITPVFMHMCHGDRHLEGGGGQGVL